MDSVLLKSIAESSAAEVISALIYFHFQIYHGMAEQVLATFLSKKNWAEEELKWSTSRRKFSIRSKPFREILTFYQFTQRKHSRDLQISTVIFKKNNKQTETTETLMPELKPMI